MDALTSLWDSSHLQSSPKMVQYLRSWLTQMLQCSRMGALDSKLRKAARLAARAQGCLRPRPLEMSAGQTALPDILYDQT
jgi:hypothetical protein